MLHYAHAYAASAIALTKVKIDTTHPDAPVRFLFSHAIELYLKAYLLLKEVPVEDLRSREFGHNLEKLASEAVNLGLCVSPEHRAGIGLANEAMLDRYIETGVRRVLPPESLSAICSNLNEQIGPAIYLAAGLTRRPKQLEKDA
jgi:hypothetical protein